jgi:hypothetical protein
MLNLIFESVKVLFPGAQVVALAILHFDKDHISSSGDVKSKDFTPDRLASG